MNARIPFHLHQHDRREHRYAGWSFEPRNARRFKGSSGGQTTVQQSGPPADVLANYSKVFNQAQNVAAQPYQPNTGATVAGFSPLQQSAFSNLPSAINAGQPFIDQASQDITNASTALDPSHFADTTAAYQSPYTQRVVDATQAEFDNQNQQQQQKIIGNAISSGAWGGDRSAVAQGITAGQQALAQAPVIANLYNTGFQNATNAAQANAWLQSQAGFGMANLGQEAQQQGLTGVQAELGAGSAQQGQQQTELNAPYQAYLAAQGYPYQTTNWLEGMATGTGSLSGTQGSTTSPGPSTASQVAGLGIAGLGAYNALNNSGAFNGWGGPTYTNGAAGLVYGSSADAAAAAASGSNFAGSAVPDILASAASRGGKIGGFAPGGAVPDLAINAIPETAGAKSNGLLGGSNNLLGGGGNLLYDSTGTTSTTTGGNEDSTFGTILKDAGIIAAGIYGGPAGGMAASALSSQVHFDQGGKVGGLSPVPIHPRGFDVGGSVTPGLDASVGGNPMLAQAAQSYNGLPTEQLQELAARLPSNSPQGSLVQRALQMRHTNPGSNPAQPMVSQPGMAAMGDQPQGLAQGGTPEDDDALPELVIPQAGPSVPGGLSAGLTAMQGAPEQMLTQHAMAMNKSGSYVPPPADLAPVVQAAAERHGVDPKPLAWLLSQESHWNPQAYNPSSHTKGLGQFKDATAREVGIDPWDAHQAIDGSAAYLRRMLNKHGDYENAIAHYGTFSTGHGPEADNAVRRQYRAFMQGAARGGAVRLADGGDPDTDPSGLLVPGTATMATPMGSDQYPTRAAVPGLTPIPPTTDPSPPAGITNGSGASIPPPTGGLGSLPEGEDRQPIKASPWEAVMAAGLGMMAGTSPHALTNIGTGGLAGLKSYQQQKQLAIQDQIRRDTADTNAIWRLSQAKTAGLKVDQYGRIVDATVALKNAQTGAVPVITAARATSADAAARRADAAGLVGQARVDYIRTQTEQLPRLTDIKQQNADTGTTRATTGADVGAARVPLIQAQTAAVPVNAQSRAVTAATGQGGLALRQQALAAMIAQRGITNDRNAVNDAQRQINTMTTEQLQAITAGKNPITGVGPSTSQAGTTVSQLRANAQRAAPPPRVVPLVATPVTQPAPTARPAAQPPLANPLPPGLPPGARQAPDGNWYVPNPSGGYLRAVPSGG